MSQHEQSENNAKEITSQTLKQLSATVKNQTKFIETFVNIYADSQKLQEKAARKVRRDSFIIAFLTFFGVAATIFTKSAWDYHQESLSKQATYIANLQHEVENLKDNRDLVDIAISDIRSARDTRNIMCNKITLKVDKNEMLSELRKEQLARINLLKADYLTKELFDNIVHNSIKKLNESLDWKGKRDICDVSSPSDEKLRNVQRFIYSLMENEVLKKEIQLKNAKVVFHKKPQ